MKTKQPPGSTLPPQEHPLYRAFKHLAEDLRTLFELASREDEKSWKNYISLVKEEIKALQPQSHLEQDEMLLYKALIEEFYDHLTMLVNTMKSSQERYKQLATRDMLTGEYNRNYFNETIVRDIERAKRYGERLSFILIDINDSSGSTTPTGTCMETASCGHARRSSENPSEKRIFCAGMAGTSLSSSRPSPPASLTARSSRGQARTAGRGTPNMPRSITGCPSVSAALPGYAEWTSCRCSTRRISRCTKIRKRTTKTVKIFPEKASFFRGKPPTRVKNIEIPVLTKPAQDAKV